MMRSFFTFTVTLAALTILKFVYGLDESVAIEMECPVLKTDPNINREWIQSIPTWYFPIWSQLTKYRMAALDLGKPVLDITEKELLNGCETYNPNNTTSTGFHHAGVHFTEEVLNDGSRTFHADSNNNLGETKLHFVLSDNKEFVIGVFCWSDNQASWMLASKTPTITSEIRNITLNHVKSMGFDLTKLVEESYEHCDDPTPSEAPEKL